MDAQDARDLDYGIMQSVRALVTAMGMQAENQFRVQCGRQIAYGEEAFQKVLDDEQMNHNSVISRWIRR
jgi:hypothetical protein